MMKLRSLFVSAPVIVSGVLFLALSTPLQAALLDVPIGYPKVDSDSGAACSYDAGAGALDLAAIPTIVYFESTETNLGFVDGTNTPATVSVHANINNAGTLSGGTFTLNGDLTDFNTSTLFPSPLLTGTIVAYGISLPGTSDSVDFRIQPTGGSLLTRFAPGDQIGVRVTMEGSTFGGVFTASWGCARDKFIVGPTPPLVQESCAVTLSKIANPTTIGPITRRPGHDREDDSDDDNDDNGHGYSRDEDDASISCGCRGKVSQLRLRYNGHDTAKVKVTRNAPYSVALYSGIVQPGAEFTVPASNYGPEGFAGTLGTSIQIAVNGGEAVDVDTSGAKDIGPGFQAGDFEVLSGKSRKLTKPLCPMPGTYCPANQQVTYTYTATNNGSALTQVALDDDKLGNILTNGALAAGQTVTFTKTACLSQTTTNTATFMGKLPSGRSCPATPAQATVTLLMPPPNCNKGHDCDPEHTPPPPPPGKGGCGTDYWKSHHKKWGKSFKQDDKFGAVFGVDAVGNRSLNDTLQIDGGGSKELGREAVSALLNASNPDVNYDYTPNQVRDIVKEAFRTKDYDTATNNLKQRNKNVCPRPDSDGRD